MEKRSDMLANKTKIVLALGSKPKGIRQRKGYCRQRHNLGLSGLHKVHQRDLHRCLQTAAHLGSMITQNNKPIAFFSGKLTGAHTRYSITEIELLAIVETLKEFKKDAVGPRTQSVHRSQ